MTPKEVLALCREKDVKAVDLRFMDFPGLWQHFTIPAASLDEDVFEDGLGASGGDAQGQIQLQKGGIELSVTRQDVGGETEHVEAEYSGEEMTIAFNSRYLNDGVGAIDAESVILDVMDPLKPGVLRGEGSDDYLYLLMPVRL